MASSLLNAGRQAGRSTGLAVLGTAAWTVAADDARAHAAAARTASWQVFLTPLGVSQYQLAKAVDVPARRINEIVHGQRRITADTALRLSRYFGTSERFWLNLQARYDLETEKDRLGGALDDIRPLSAAS